MARLTLIRAKEVLSDRCSPDKLEYRLNRVCERLILNGKWVGSLQTIAIVASYGQIALPGQYRTIEGVRVSGLALELTNKWYSWLPGFSDMSGFSMTAVRDLGDNYATMYHLPIGGSKYTSQPSVTITGDGTGATASATVDVRGRVTGTPILNYGLGYTFANVTISGGGGNGATAVATVSGGQVTDIRLLVGGNLRLSYPGTETLTMIISGTDINYLPLTLTIAGNTTVANPFMHIDRVHTETVDVNMTLTHIDVNNVITNLAIMAPTDEEFLCRRYMVDTLYNQPSAVVAALVKIRHREFVSDQDLLPIDNISALSLGLDALNFEDQNALDIAEKYWERAIGVLNNELGDDIARNMDPSLRFIYPGGTAPRLTSHY